LIESAEERSSARDEGGHDGGWRGRGEEEQVEAGLKVDVGGRAVQRLF